MVHLPIVYKQKESLTLGVGPDTVGSTIVKLARDGDLDLRKKLLLLLLLSKPISQLHIDRAVIVSKSRTDDVIDITTAEAAGTALKNSPNLIIGLKKSVL